MFRASLSREEMERRRLAAAKDLLGGMTQADVARKYGVKPASACRWNAALQKNGPDGLRLRKARGREPALGVKQLARLERILVDGAAKYGFDTDLWTIPRVVKVARQEFGVRLHRSNVHRTLRRMGFTWQKPARRARERDEEAVQTWVRTEWPRIVKRGRA